MPHTTSQGYNDVVREGGGGLPYVAYTGTCHWTGYGFLVSLS